MADLIFLDANGNQIISDKDPTGVTLDFGQIVAGNSSSIIKMFIGNMIKVSNIIVRVESIPQGDVIEISKSDNPFIPSQQINFDGTFEPVGNRALMVYGGSAIASSTHSSAPQNAFDGNTSTYWEANGYTGWIKRDLGIKVSTNKLRFIQTKPNVTVYSLQGSNDDVNWNYIVTPKITYSTTWVEEVYSEVSYRFYRINFDKSGSGYYPRVLEIELIRFGLPFYVRVKPGEDSSGSKSFRIKAKATPV